MTLLEESNKRKPEEHLKGKKVAIVGLGLSQVDFAIAQQNSRTWDEVWCINSAGYTYPCQKIFMLDPASRFFDSDDAGKQTSVMQKLLSETDTPFSHVSLMKESKTLFYFLLKKYATQQNALT